MRVKATSPGFYGHYRIADDEFEVPDGSKASWFVPVEGEADHKPAKPGRKKAESVDLASAPVELKAATPE